MKIHITIGFSKASQVFFADSTEEVEVKQVVGLVRAAKWKFNTTTVLDFAHRIIYLLDFMFDNNAKLLMFEDDDCPQVQIKIR